MSVEVAALQGRSSICDDHLEEPRCMMMRAIAGKVQPTMRCSTSKDAESESDEDNSDASSSTKASAAGGSCSENESVQVRGSTYDEGSDTESFCSAFETASEFGDDNDTDSFYDPVQVGSCVFSVASLLNLRAKMLHQEGPQSLSPKAGSLRCQARAEEALAQDSRSPASSSTPASPASPAWKPMRSMRSVEDSHEKFSRSARAILNKLTVEKFDILYEQIVNCGVRTPEQVAILMREIFDKATAQHHFIPMYADLCARLEPDPRILSALESVEVAQRSTFRRLLLGQCQSAFEQLLQPEPKMSSPSEEEEEMQARKKQKKLGNVKLVGELLLRGMLKSQLLCSCSEDLLRNWEKCPEAIESLAALLTVAAPRFDVEDWSHRQRLTQIFDDISKLVWGKALPSRLRFLLKDVLELRVAGWPGRAKSGPVRLQEVRKAASGSFSGSETPQVRKATSGSFSGGETPKFFHKGPPSRSAWTSPRSPANVAKEHQAPLPCKAQKSESAALLRLAEICMAPAPGGPSSANFDISSFHKFLSALLRDLKVEHNATAAVKQVRAQQVPIKYQAREFADLITRTVEDNCGPSRRSAFAFLVGLCSCEDSAFDRDECMKGTATFFAEVYPDLQQEVPRLDKILSAELLPMLRSAWSPLQFNLDKILPQELRLKA